MSKNNWFYYFEGSRAVGPLEKADMLERIESQKLGPYQLVIRSGDEEWQPALAFSEFREQLLKQKTDRVPNQSWIILKRQDAGGHLAVESLGPFTSEEVRQQLQAGRIEYTDYAWKDGMHQWRRVSSLKDFSPFEKAVETPEPLVTMPPAPKIAREVTKSDVLKKVEVVTREVEQPVDQLKDPSPPPPEAAGPDLAKTIVAPQPKPVFVEAPLPPPRLAKKSSPQEPPLPKAPPRFSRPRENGQNRVVRKESVTNAMAVVKEISNRRVTLPRQWKQILVILVLLFALYVKLFGGPDTIPLSQVPQFSTQPNPAPIPLPEPSSMNSASPNEPEEKTPPSDTTVGKPEMQAPIEKESATEKPVQLAKKKPHPPTRLHAHMSVQGEQTSLSLDTDAGTDQVVTIEIRAAAGQVVDHSHYFRLAKWTPGHLLDISGTLPPGFYSLHVAVGSLTTDEKFEIGTQAKSFPERLRLSRKQNAYEFWNERKRLMVLSRQIGKLLATRKNSELDRLSRFQPTSFAFRDLWVELKEICQLVKKSDPSAKGRLLELQNKISQLSIWK